MPPRLVASTMDIAVLSWAAAALVQPLIICTPLLELDAVALDDEALLLLLVDEAMLLLDAMLLEAMVVEAMVVEVMPPMPVVVVPVAPLALDMPPEPLPELVPEPVELEALLPHAAIAPAASARKVARRRKIQVFMASCSCE